MTTTRRWLAGAVAAALVLVLASWFLLISPQRSQAADLRDQATAQQDRNDSIRLRTQQLKAQFASLPQRQAELAEIRRQLPGQPDLASLVRQLSTAAGDAGVSLTAVRPGGPQPLAGGAAAGGAASAGAAASGTSGVQAIALTTVLEGSYAELTLFVQKLQGSMTRAYLVESLSLAPVAGAAATASGSELTLTLIGKVFVLPSALGTATAAPSTPASNPASAPANSTTAN